jgi:hypothetical protein
MIGAYGLLSLLEAELWRYMDQSIMMSIFIIFLIALILSIFLVRYDFKHRIMHTLKTEKRMLVFTYNTKKLELEAFQFFKVSKSSLFYILIPYRKINLYFKGPKTTTLLSLFLPKKEIEDTIAQLKDFYHIK